MKAVRPEAKAASQYIDFFPDRPFNDVRYFIDSSKLHALGWKPEASSLLSFQPLLTHVFY